MPKAPTGFDPPRPEPGTSQLDQLWAACRALEGVPYVFGGKDIARDGGLDCSGFVVKVFADIGIDLGPPDFTSAQRIYDNAIDTGDDVRVGDLIFFTRTYAPADPVTHLGIIRVPQPVGQMWDTHVPPGVGLTDYTSDYWQAHYYGHRRIPGLEVPSVTGSPWSVEEIAAAASSPLENVAANWPRILQELQNVGQASKASLAAAIGTVAIETVSTFEPVVEAFWLDEAARWRWYADTTQHAPYSGGPQFFGRGFPQLTHDHNYRSAGDALGIDLVSNPDLALDPDISARIFAHFWASHDLQSLADAGQWATLRKRFQGGSAGLDRLISISTALLA